jgi:two-component sensor histidine kinase
MPHDAMNDAQPPTVAPVRHMEAHDLILRELHHRVANTLAMLHASCRLDFAGVADPRLKEGLHRHERHIQRLAEFHHFLSRGAGFGKVVAADYFRALFAVLSRSVLEPVGLHYEAFVGEGTLDACACETLGLILSELVINAAKHGFQGRSCGCVRIEIHAPDGMAWCCSVADDGSGMQSGQHGAGSGILDGLIQMLDGRMVVETCSNGTTVTILFPASPAETSGPPLVILADRDDTAWHCARG